MSVLDFLNDADTIREAFADYYRATILADETDPNKLHDLPADLDRAQVYSEEQVDELGCGESDSGITNATTTSSESPAA